MKGSIREQDAIFIQIRKLSGFKTGEPLNLTYRK